MTIEQFKREMRRLIWATCRQREKVPSILPALLKQLYPDDKLGELRKLIELEFINRINGVDR